MSIVTTENDEKPRPIIGHRKIAKMGRSLGITLPHEWFRVHGIDPDKVDELLVIANMDIRIVNPEHEAEVYKEVTKIARDVR